jgi:hypothetical protein
MILEGVCIGEWIEIEGLHHRLLVMGDMGMVKKVGDKEGIWRLPTPNKAVLDGVWDV